MMLPTCFFFSFPSGLAAAGTDGQQQQQQQQLYKRKEIMYKITALTRLPIRAVHCDGRLAAFQKLEFCLLSLYLSLFVLLSLLLLLLLLTCHPIFTTVQKSRLLSQWLIPFFFFGASRHRNFLSQRIHHLRSLSLSL